METKYCFAKVKRINEQERTLDAIASTSDLDRDKDIILPSAFEKSLKAFRDNPVILACHQHRLPTGNSPVIGSAIPESIKIEETKVTFTMRFAGTPLGEEYWQLYRDKHMRAFSVGFIPIEFEDKKDEKLGWIRTYTKIELLEISAVPVPSNRRALARAKGFFENDDIKDAVTEAVKQLLSEHSSNTTKEILELKSFIENELDEVKTLLIADRDRFADELLLGSPSERSDPAGENDIAEQQLKRIENSLNFGDQNHANQ